MTTERFDDWITPHAAIGGPRDKSRATTFVRRPRLGRETLTALYEQNSIAARVVDRLPYDALREGWEFTETDADIDPRELESRLDGLHINTMLGRAVRWSRLYGGALLCVPTIDAGQPGDPLDVRTITHVSRPFVSPAHDVIPLTMDAAFGSDTYLDVLTYDLVGALTLHTVVHHSRVVRFEPIELPQDDVLRSGRFWGPSVLERIVDDLGRLGVSRNHAIAMMHVASVMYLQMKGYRDSFKTPESRTRMQNMLAAAVANMTSLGLIALDEGDTLGNLSLSVSGAHDLIERMVDAVASSAEMPREILLNESPAGLNAGELSGPQEIWFARVASFQQDVLTPAIDRLLEIILPAWGIKATRWKIKWRSLWNKSDEKQSAVDKTRAETAAILIDTGVATPDEFRDHMLVQGRTGLPEIEPSAPAAPLDLSQEIEAEGVEPDDRNGEAMSAALVDLVAKVKLGEIPRESAVAIVRASFPSVAHMADEILPQQPELAPVAGAAPGEISPEGDDASVAPPAVEPPPDDLVSPREAAERLHVPTRAITRAIERGDLRYWGLGAHKRVSLADVVMLGRAHEQPADAPDEPEDDAPAA